MARIALEQLYPAYAGLAQSLRAQGIADEDILEGIIEANRELESRGFSKEEIQDFVNQKSFEEPRPGLGTRALQSVGREASFGLFQPEQPEAEGIPEALADLVGTFLGFAVPAGAAKIAAGRFATPLLSRLIPAATTELGAAARSAAVKGVPEALAFTGLTETGRAIGTGEVPSAGELGQNTLLNTLLFTLGEGLGGARGFNRTARGAAIDPASEITRSMLLEEPQFRTAGEIPVEDLLRGVREQAPIGREAPTAPGPTLGERLPEFDIGELIRLQQEPRAIGGLPARTAFDIPPRPAPALPREPLVTPEPTFAPSGAIRQPGRVGPQAAIPEEAAGARAATEARIKAAKKRAKSQTESLKKAFVKHGRTPVLEELITDSNTVNPIETISKTARKAEARVSPEKPKVRRQNRSILDAIKSDVKDIREQSEISKQGSFVSEIGPSKGPVRFSIADLSELELVSTLKQAAESVGFKVAFEKHRLGSLLYVEGLIDGKVTRRYFSHPRQALDVFVRDDGYAAPPTSTRIQLAGEVIAADAAKEFTELKPPSTEKISRKCSSPCRLAPERGEMLDDVKVAEVYARLGIDSPLEIQLAEAARKQELGKGLGGVWGRIKDFSKLPKLQKFFSPSFWLETTSEGREFISLGDKADRGRVDQIVRGYEKFYGKQRFAGAKRRGGFDDLKIETDNPAIIEAGYALENPEARVSGMAKRVAKFAEDFWEWAFRETAEVRPDLKIGYVKNYLYRVFDRNTLIKHFEAEIESLKFDNSKTAAARLVQMTEALDGFKSGAGLLYENIPRSLRAPMFESRVGGSDYSFNVIKAIDAYLSTWSRKLHIDAVLPKMLDLIDKLPEGHRSLAREYLRDLSGVKDKIPGSENHILNLIREAQFIRTFGFNPSIPVKNAFQAAFTVVDVGTKASLEGLQSALKPEGRAIFERSGHPASIPGMFLEKRHGLQSKWKRAVDAAGFLFNKVEFGNRIHAYMSGLSKWYGTEGAKRGLKFQDALDKGWDFIPEEAKTFADTVVRRNQFRYGKADLPLGLRGPVVGTLFQFSSFSIKASELMWKWAVREGMPGRLKLASLFALGMGASTIGGALGVPTIGEGVAAPINMTEMVALLSAMSQQDWVKARQAIINLPATDTFLPAFGPAGQALGDLQEITRRAGEGETTKKLIQRFGERNVLPVMVSRLFQAVEQWDAGGSARDFVQVLSGMPNATALIRREAMRLIERGQADTYRDFLRAVASQNGGVLPATLINPRAVARLRAEHRKETRLRKAELKKETPTEKGIRRLRGRAENLIRNPLFTPRGII